MTHFKRFQSPNQYDIWLLPLTVDLKTFDMSWADPAEILDENDIDRYHRFRVPSKKNEMIISRLFLKRLIKNYFTSGSSEIQIKPDEYGRPLLYRANQLLPLYFSLSHTDGMMTCMFGLTPILGVDVEYIEAAVTFEGGSVFSPEEALWCEHCEDRSNERYYILWTLKEAFLKALGQGFLIPLDGFSFSFHNKTIRIEYDDAPDFGCPNSWYFSSSKLYSNYIMSQAIRAETAPIMRCYKLGLAELYENE